MDAQTGSVVVRVVSGSPWWQILGGIGGLAIGVGSFFVSLRIWRTQQAVHDLAQETKRGNDSRAAPVPLVLGGTVKVRETTGGWVIQVLLRILNAGDVPIFLFGGKFRLGPRGGDPVDLEGKPSDSYHTPIEVSILQAHNVADVRFRWETGDASRLRGPQSLTWMELELITTSGTANRTARWGEWRIEAGPESAVESVWVIFPKPSSMKIDTEELTKQLIQADLS